MTFGFFAIGGSLPLSEFKSTIVVKKPADFGPPLAGAVTLAANTAYLIDGSVSMSDRFIVSSKSSIISLDRNINTLEYTGVGAMFTGDNADLNVNNVTINCPNGQLVDYTDTVTTQKSVIRFQTVRFTSIDNIGQVTDIGSIRFISAEFLSVVSDGLDVNGTINLLTYDLFLVTQLAGKFLDLGTAIINQIFISDFGANVSAGAVFLSGLVNNGNIPVGGQGQVTGGNITGAGTPLENITRDDVRWFFEGNNPIEDTREVALASLENNVLVTTISAPNTPVKVNGGTAFVNADSSFFTISNTGTITYIGARPFRAIVDISTSISAETGVNKDITVYLALDGSVISGSGSVNRVDSNDRKNTTIVWELELVNGNTLDVFVENNSDSINLIATSVTHRVA